MRPSWLLLTVLGAAPALAGHRAAPPVRVAVFFWHESANDGAAYAGFRAGLRTAKLDWTLRVYRAGGDEKRARTQLAAIRAAAFDLVLALGTRATQLARAAAADRPIVFTAVTNPVESGIVPDWRGSRSGLAGNSNWLPARALLRAFRGAVPKLRTLGVIRDPKNPVSRAEVHEAVAAARGQQPPVRLRIEDVLRKERIGVAAERLRDAGVDAVWVPIDHLVYRNLGPVQQVCDAARIPILTSAWRATRAAAVMGIVPDYHVLGLQAADLARRILVGGAAPGSLPVGRLRSFRTVVNLKAAARCSHRVPLAVLAVADEVIR